MNTGLDIGLMQQKHYTCFPFSKDAAFAKKYESLDPSPHKT